MSATQSKGWTPWPGGECPVPPEMRVDVMFGVRSVLTAIRPDSIDWSREGDEDDIVSYRQSAHLHANGSN